MAVKKETPQESTASHLSSLPLARSTLDHRGHRAAEQPRMYAVADWHGSHSVTDLPPGRAHVLNDQEVVVDELREN